MQIFFSPRYRIKLLYYFFFVVRKFLFFDCSREEKKLYLPSSGYSTRFYKESMFSKCISIRGDGKIKLTHSSRCIFDIAWQEFEKFISNAYHSALSESRWIVDEWLAVWLLASYAFNAYRWSLVPGIMINICRWILKLFFFFLSRVRIHLRVKLTRVAFDGHFSLTIYREWE